MPDLKSEGGKKVGLKFKNQDFVHANVQNGKKKPWKTLKQILAQVGSKNWFLCLVMINGNGILIINFLF